MAPRLELHSPEAEQRVIGACLMEPDRVPGLMHLDADDFADPRRAAIWVGMRGCGGSAFTAASLAARMGAACTSDVRDELRAIESEIFTAVGVEDLAQSLVSLSTRRRILRASSRIAEAVGSAVVDAERLVALAHSEIIAATARSGRSRPLSMGEVLAKTVPLLQEYRAAQGGLTGLSTGIASLDAMTSGMHPGELWLLAARPGCGKTALALAMVLEAARKGIPVGFGSLEMPDTQLAVRAVSAESGISQTRLRRGTYGEREHPAMLTAFETLNAMPVLVWDNFGIGLADMRALALQVRARYGSIGLLVVDYLQLMSGSGRDEARHLEVASFSRGLKALSKEIGCPVLALSQLSRDGAKTGRKPQLSDLRESGSLEQDADTVIFLHGDGAPDSSGSVAVELIIGKQRNGPRGSVDLQFNGQSMSFKEAK